jgi:hypothetical protein
MISRQYGLFSASHVHAFAIPGEVPTVRQQPDWRSIPATGVTTS